MVEPGRPNLFAKYAGVGGGPSLLINSHADTVGYGNWRERAFVHDAVAPANRRLQHKTLDFPSRDVDDAQRGR